MNWIKSGVEPIWSWTSAFETCCWLVCLYSWYHLKAYRVLGIFFLLLMHTFKFLSYNCSLPDGYLVSQPLTAGCQPPNNKCRNVKVSSRLFPDLSPLSPLPSRSLSLLTVCVRHTQCMHAHACSISSMCVILIIMQLFDSKVLEESLILSETKSSIIFLMDE